MSGLAVARPIDFGLTQPSDWAARGRSVTTTETFGALLRRYRQAASLSQEALAERAQLSINAIAALERGRRTAPRPATVLLIADGLQLAAAERDLLIGAAAAARGSVASRSRAGPPRAPLAPLGPAQRLPAELTPLIGREGDAEQVQRLLETSRLVTLTGVGGIGKTRLAVAVANAVGRHFADGVWLVDLVPLVDADLVPATVAHSLGLRETSRPTSETLVDVLRGREILLVLDSCEHVVDACAALAHQLLTSCPGLRIVATSRQPLQTAGETVWRVPPLAVPAGEEPRAQEFASVQLFVDRAQAADATFGLTAANAAAVAEICSRLDGIPLALHLAAAWVGTLAVSQIVERLDDCFKLLTHTSRTAPTRQRTLRATLDWSHDLLSEPEQRLFRRLAAFSGPFSLDAAEGVCADGSLVRDDVLDVLASLVDKSLVVAEHGPSMRQYRLLEPVRQYAELRLRESGELDVVCECHAGYYLALAEQAAPELSGPRRGEWLDRLEAEHGNLTAALLWQRENGDHDRRGLRMATALWRFWWLRSYFAEGRTYLNELLNVGDEPPSSVVRARALHALGELAFREGDIAGAHAPLDAAHDLFRSAGDPLGIAFALRSLGRLMLDEGKHDTARVLLEEDLQIERGLGYRTGLPWSLTYLGWLATFDGRFDEARALLDEGLAECRALGDREGIGRQLFSLGHLELELGQLAAARAAFAEALSVFADLDYKYGLAYALEGLADVAASSGEPTRAVRLGGAADALRQVTGVAASPEFRARHTRRQDQARAMLGLRAARQAWAAGQALSARLAVAEALAFEARGLVSGRKYRGQPAALTVGADASQT